MDPRSDTAMTDATPATPSVPLFRPNKRRKVYRQRVDDDTPDSDAPATKQEPETIDDLISSARAQAEEKELAEILRLRKQKKLRSGGVEFRADGTTSADGQAGRELAFRDEEGERDLVKEAEAEALKKVVGRFAPQMGVMGGEGIVDRHMMSYIDSELAKRRFESGQDQAQSSLDNSNANLMRTVPVEQSNRPVGDRQPAMLGKLQEIDLGDEHREYNMSRTRRYLNGEESTPSEADKKDKSNESDKPRPGLGPDGKPWRPRKKRSRNSEDIRRDALVEEVLRENRIELYDDTQVFAPGKGIYKEEEEDGAADDRIAEEFKKDFMDAMSQRQRRRPEKAGAGVKGKLTKEEELLKGPKLGGSKSQRAAMREMVLKGEIPPPRVRK